MSDTYLNLPLDEQRAPRGYRRLGTRISLLDRETHAVIRQTTIGTMVEIHTEALGWALSDEDLTKYEVVTHRVYAHWTDDALAREQSSPFIKWKHVDGPCLVTSTGESYWLSLWDRFAMWVGLTDLLELEKKALMRLRGEV